MSNTTNTQNAKLVRRLAAGRQITVAEARSRYGIKRLSARIFELRKRGFAIYTSQKVMGGGVNRGRRVTTYGLQVNKTPKHLIESFGATK